MVTRLDCEMNNDVFFQAVGVGAEFVKLGGFCRGERACKYNRLIEVEKQLHNTGALQQNTQTTFTIAKQSVLGMNLCNHSSYWLPTNL